MGVIMRDLMAASGVNFGTSGARGLVSQLTDRVACGYTIGFLNFLAEAGELAARPAEVAVAGDLRPSTGRLMGAVMLGVEAFGGRPLHCGRIPSPALADYGFRRRIPTIMVTGSHIPDDRNGIKFNRCTSELFKEDEAALLRQQVELPEARFDDAGMASNSAAESRPVVSAAGAEYARRYVDAFGAGSLAGLRIGVYEHSAVGRDLIVEILQALGADVVRLGRSDRFIPVDTEAVRPEDVELAARWAKEHSLDSIVTADGDSDRPLVSDEQGRWIRGDVAGILVARFLGAESVSVPVSCNTAVERCGWFREVRRTRIGSPYVAAAMVAAQSAGFERVAGYEANGGFLLQTPVRVAERELGALPTRDAMVVILAIVCAAKTAREPVSALVAALPGRFTASDRLTNFANQRSQAVLQRLGASDAAGDHPAIADWFGAECGRLSRVDRTDGLRMTFDSGEVVHLRASGNAPEFRCYAEADSETRARDLIARCLRVVEERSANLAAAEETEA